MKLKGFFIDPEGKVRRGVPGFVIDEDGGEKPDFREHNTGISYPRDAEKASDDKATDEKPSE